MDLNTGDQVTTCNMSSPLTSCSARCDCKGNWYGYDCQINKEQLSELATMQTNILTTLSQVSVEIKTSKILLSVINSVSLVMNSASRQPISTTTVEMSASVIKNILKSAILMPNITISNVQALTSNINSVIISSLSSFSSPSSSTASSLSLQKSISQLCQTYVDGITRSNSQTIKFTK